MIVVKKPYPTLAPGGRFGAGPKPFLHMTHPTRTGGLISLHLCGLLQLKVITFEMAGWLFLTSFHLNSDLQFYIRHPIGVK